MIRTGLCLSLACVVLLAACDRKPAPRDPAQDAARNMVMQSALFCPNEGFSWETFDAMATRLGAKPDGGDFRRPPTIRKGDLVRERWVALNQLGYRTTVWIGELGPGHYYPDGIPEPVQYKSGLACVVHDPTLSREQAFALTEAWGKGKLTGGLMTRPGDPSSFIALARVWINSPPGAGFYQDIEMRLDKPDHHDGAMLIRRRYEFRDPGARGSADGG